MSRSENKSLRDSLKHIWSGTVIGTGLVSCLVFWIALRYLRTEAETSSVDNRTSLELLFLIALSALVLWAVWAYILRPVLQIRPHYNLLGPVFASAAFWGLLLGVSIIFVGWIEDSALLTGELTTFLQIVILWMTWNYIERQSRSVIDGILKTPE